MCWGPWPTLCCDQATVEDSREWARKVYCGHGGKPKEIGVAHVENEDVVYAPKSCPKEKSA